LFEMTWSIVAYAAIAWAGMWVIAFIPLVRGIVARSPGLQVFLTGVIILQCLLPTFHGLPSYGHGLLATPGIIESIGYLILTGILVRLMWFLSFSLFHLIESRGGMPHDLRVAPKVIAPLLTMLVGFSHYSCMLAT
jgi:hypothetical protein